MTDKGHPCHLITAMNEDADEEKGLNLGAWILLPNPSALPL
jgi:hypothetical protein